MNNDRNNKVEDILNSLDGVNRASTPDFFYTRLMARMEKGLGPLKRSSPFLRPAYVLAGLLVILAVNIFVFLNNSNNNDNDAIAATDDNESVQQSIASEYRINENPPTIYDLNQDR